MQANRQSVPPPPPSLPSTTPQTRPPLPPSAPVPPSAYATADLAGGVLAFVLKRLNEARWGGDSGRGKDSSGGGGSGSGAGSGSETGSASGSGAGSGCGMQHASSAALEEGSLAEEDDTCVICMDERRTARHGCCRHSCQLCRSCQVCCADDPCPICRGPCCLGTGSPCPICRRPSSSLYEWVLGTVLSVVRSVFLARS